MEIATQTVDEGTTVTFHCNLPTDANGGELHWRREDETSLSYDANDEDGILTITNVRLSDAGTYICFTEDPETGDRIDSAPASLIVNPVARMLSFVLFGLHLLFFSAHHNILASFNLQ